MSYLKNARFGLESGRFEQGPWAVYPNSILFEAGEYPDKGLSINPAELKAMVDGFKTFGGNIEHTSFLAGKACQVRSVWVDPNGTTLRGEVAIPLGLDTVLGDDDKKLSVEIAHDSKLLCGLALCVTPRVRHAALMSVAVNLADGTGKTADELVTEMEAVFGTSAQFRSDNPLQSMHDQACREGAECPGKSLMSQAAAFSTDASADSRKKAEFITPALLKSIQHVHDHTAKNGANCDQYVTRRDYSYWTANRAFTSPAAPANRENRIMKFADTVQAWFAAGCPLEFKQGEAAATTTTTDQAPAATTVATLSDTDRALMSTLLKDQEENKKTIAELTAQVALAANKISAAESDGRLKANLAWIETQRRCFKITPAATEMFIKTATDNADAFDLLKPAIEAQQPISSLAGYREGTVNVGMTDDVTEKFTALVKKRCDEKKITYNLAMSEIARENPELALEYRSAQMVG